MSVMKGGDLLALIDWYPHCKKLRDEMAFLDGKQILQVLFVPGSEFPRKASHFDIEYKELGYTKHYWATVDLVEDSKDGMV